MSQDALDGRVAHEGIGQRRLGAGRQQIEIAARLGAAPDAAHGDNRRRRRMADEIRHQRIGHLSGLGQQVTAGVTLALFDRLEDQVLFLRAHSLDATNTARLRRLAQVVEALDVQLLVQERHGLGPNPLQAQHLQQRFGEFLQQLLADLACASGRNIANAGGEVLANARPRAQPGFV